MREKTNSITHLVKTVAGEVFDEKMKQRVTEYPDCPRRYFHSHFSSTRAGEPWTQVEDDLLVQEVDFMLTQIASKHGRTTGAISSRISQRGIF